MGEEGGLCQLAVVLEVTQQIAGCWCPELRMQVWIVPQVLQLHITGQQSCAFTVISGANLCDLSRDSAMDVFRTSEERAAIFFQSGF